MKKLLSILTICFLTFLVAGCGDDNKSTNDNTANEQEQSDNTSNSDQDTNADPAQTNNDLPFNEFSLEVKYPNNQEYEADYEYEHNTIDASIEDDVNNTRVTGNEAEKQLGDILKSLDIDAQTSEKDVISKVISAFDVADNYQAIEVDITFTDGTEKEYHAKK
ncbi:YusW family protein [Pradoshia sp.]